MTLSNTVQFAVTPTSGGGVYPFGYLPSGVSQATLQSNLRTAYNAWVTLCLTTTGATQAGAGAYRVQRPDQGNDTVSEGIGYGMLITVLMGNPANPQRDANAQGYFNGLWTYYQHYADPNGLMNWQIGPTGTVLGTGSATDADEDVAFALLLADRVWGSAGAVNYQAAAKTLIGQIMTSDIDQATWLYRNGDSWGATNQIAADYFAPSYYREFQALTGDTRWGQVISASYPVAQGYPYGKYTHGMVPDWMDKTSGNALAGQSYLYSYNAVRYPFRIVLDYLWNGGNTNTLAHDAPLRLAQWSNTQSGAAPNSTWAEWALDASAHANYSNTAFNSGFALAGMVDSTQSIWSGTLAQWLATNCPTDQTYFGESLGVIALAILAGQAYIPASQASTPAVVTALVPANAVAGTAAFTLTVNGTGIQGGAVVLWNGAALTTTFVSATQVTASVPAGDVAAAGTAGVQVRNPAAGASNTATFTILSPPATLTSLSPSSGLAGGQATNVQVNGRGFVAGASATVGGQARTCTYQSATAVVVALTAADLASAGTLGIVVTNPSVGPSNSLAFTVNRPAPTLTTLTPSSVTAGGSAVTLTIGGQGFSNGAVASAGGAALPTTFVSTTQLTATLSAALIANPATLSVTVSNAAPSVGPSNALNFTVSPSAAPAATVTAISPNSALAGAGALTLVVTGAGFVNGSTVTWNGTARTTAYVSGTQVTATIPAGDLAAAGTVAVGVLNPSPAPASATVPFTINAVPAGPPTQAPRGVLYAWLDAAGNEHDLWRPPFRVLVGRTGLVGMPTFAVIEDIVPLQAGSRVRGMRVAPRDVTLPLLIQTGSDATLQQTIRQLATWLDPTLGPGTLRAQAADGTVRQLTAYYIGGLTGDESPTTRGPGWMRALLTLHAADPYWYSSNPVFLSFSVTTGGAFFPILPLKLGAASVLAGATVSNSGDVEAWPIWTLTGPGQTPVLTNGTTGEELTLNTTLAAGDRLVIDTRPGVKTVTLNGNVNRFGTLDPSSALWSLAPGSNQLSMSMVGATGGSTLALAFTPRFWAL